MQANSKRSYIVWLTYGFAHFLNAELLPHTVS
jgi:hypothetical protein